MSSIFEYRPEYSFKLAIRCRTHCRATKIGIRACHSASGISIGEVCWCRTR
jgi:hypothetical protein